MLESRHVGGPSLNNIKTGPSSISKHTSGKQVPTPFLNVGDLVYLYSDKDKSHARDRYLSKWCRTNQICWRLATCYMYFIQSQNKRML